MGFVDNNKLIEYHLIVLKTTKVFKFGTHSKQQLSLMTTESPSLWDILLTTSKIPSKPSCSQLHDDKHKYQNEELRSSAQRLRNEVRLCNSWECHVCAAFYRCDLGNVGPVCALCPSVCVIIKAEPLQ